MNTPDFEPDQHLQALFTNFDTKADFDARLMARLRAESQRGEGEWLAHARQQERARHGRAALELQRSLRLLTLDALGIAVLLLAVAVTAWPSLRVEVIDMSRQYGRYIAMFLAILIAVVPLLAMRAEQPRARIPLL